MLSGKVTVVTGAGRGIGAASARLLARHGARVVVNDLDQTRADETAHAITTAGGSAIAIAGSIVESGFPEKMLAMAADEYGPLDVLVNNAGFLFDGVLHKMSDEQWEAILNVHLTAPFRTVRAAAPYMRDAAKREMEGGGTPSDRCIINVSSTSGLHGNVGQANYAAAKSGILGDYPITNYILSNRARFPTLPRASVYGAVFYFSRTLSAPTAATFLLRPDQDRGARVGSLRRTFQRRRLWDDRYPNDAVLRRRGCGCGREGRAAGSSAGRGQNVGGGAAAQGDGAAQPQGHAGGGGRRGPLPRVAARFVRHGALPRGDGRNGHLRRRAGVLCRCVVWIFCGASARAYTRAQARAPAWRRHHTSRRMADGREQLASHHNMLVPSLCGWLSLSSLGLGQARESPGATSRILLFSFPSPRHELHSTRQVQTGTGEPGTYRSILKQKRKQQCTSLFFFSSASR